MNAFFSFLTLAMPIGPQNELFRRQSVDSRPGKIKAALMVAKYFLVALSTPK